MLEAAIVLELVLHKFAEGGVIFALLLLNAVLAYFQEGKAEATLAALKSRLALNASAKRDGVWKTIPRRPGPGDLVKLSLGAVVAADVKITDGSAWLINRVQANPCRLSLARGKIPTLVRGAARRGNRAGDANRAAYQVRPHLGAGTHGSLGEL